MWRCHITSSVLCSLNSVLCSLPQMVINHKNFCFISRPGKTKTLKPLSFFYKCTIKLSTGRTRWDPWYSVETMRPFFALPNGNCFNNDQRHHLPSGVSPPNPPFTPPALTLWGGINLPQTPKPPAENRRGSERGPHSRARSRAHR